MHREQIGWIERENLPWIEQGPRKEMREPQEGTIPTLDSRSQSSNLSVLGCVSVRFSTTNFLCRHTVLSVSGQHSILFHVTHANHTRSPISFILL